MNLWSRFVREDCNPPTGNDCEVRRNPGLPELGLYSSLGWTPGLSPSPVGGMEDEVARLVTIAGTLVEARDPDASGLSASLGVRKPSAMVQSAPRTAHMEGERGRERERRWTGKEDESR